MELNQLSAYLEIVAGVSYLSVAAAFYLQSLKASTEWQTMFRLGLAITWGVGGLEELVDSAVSECGGFNAELAHFSLSLGQALTGSIGAYFVIRAGLLIRNYTKG